MTDQSPLERRYRRWLALYPRSFRAEREEEMVSGGTGRSGSQVNGTVTALVVTPLSHSLTSAVDRRTVSLMASTLKAKIAAEHKLRQLLAADGLPQPDEVEYGHSCVRFLFHESRTCIVVDLDEAAGDGEADR